VSWSEPRQALPDGGEWTNLDAAGASAPCVLSAGGNDSIWYSGNDGATTRILTALVAADGTCKRRGIAIDAGFAGSTDSYGVEAPSVVRTRGGYLMAYAGSDGPITRLHAATSADGEKWKAHGPILQREGPDSTGATHPSLLVINRWWLFYSGYDGSENGRAARILAAISDDGASWDRLGVVLEPERGELAVTEPCVLWAHGSYFMFYVSHEQRRTMLGVARSLDGFNWSRLGTMEAPFGIGRGARSPYVERRSDGRWRLWFASPATAALTAPDRLWVAYREWFPAGA
jgi:predicted GH43/DUF377 family glycosyl hydrolase